TASAPTYRLEGSVLGSFGASTRQAARLSAASSKGRAPSSGGRVPSPGTRTTEGLQSSGWEAANRDKSSIRGPDGRDRLKPLASVEPTLDDPALNFLRYQRLGRAKPDDDRPPFDADLPHRLR